MRTQKCGWTAEETDTLFHEAHLADAEGRSIKSVFDKVAKLTGRRPNSIRNYYYLKLKETDGLGKISFVPFEDEEIETLIRTILSEQAKGKSVRSIALSMGNGDKKRMLRYQNKYRSMLKNDPGFIEKVMNQLDQEGVAYLNPFQNPTQRRRRPKQDMATTVSQLISNLSMLGEDGEIVLSSLSEIVGRAAASGHSCPNGQTTDLTSQLTAQERLLANYREDIQEIQEISQQFLGLSGMERIAILPEYTESVKRWMDQL